MATQVGGGRQLGRLVTIASGSPDYGEALFALNLATAYRQGGAEVLLIDGVDRPASDMPAPAMGYGLLDAVADRDQFDRATLVAAVLGADAGDPARVPVLMAGGIGGRLLARDLLAYLAAALSQFDIVVLSLGELVRHGFLDDVLTVSPRVFLLTTQDRATVRASHALLLQADPARRWRDRVTVVVDCYESAIAPTAMQITETIGVPHSVLLPIDPHTAGSDLNPASPMVLSHPDTAYSVAVIKIAANGETAMPTGLTTPDTSPPRGRSRKPRSDAAATRVAAGLTLAYLAVATPCLVGADFFFIMGRDLDIISLSDVAWSNLILAVAFLAISALFGFMMARRYFRQQAAVADQLKAVTEHALSGIAFTDADGNIRYANPVFRRLLNVSQSVTENTRLDALLASRMGGTDPRELLTAVGEGRASLRVRSGGQQELDLTLAARRVGPADSSLGWVINVQDVTSGRAFRESSAITTSVLEVAADGIVVVDLLKQNMPLIYVNKAFETITGWNRMDVIGKNCRLLQGSDRMQPEIAAMTRAIKLRKPISVVLRNYRKDGSMFWNKLHLAPVLDQTGKATHYIGIQTDVTHQRHAAEQLEQLAYFDPLTALPNRNRFRRQLAEMLDAAGSRPVAVVRIDVQRLHDVNTAAGYDRGDALLLELSRRLKQMVPQGLIGRINGGEFAVAYPHDPASSPHSFVAALRDRLLQRYELPGASLHVTFAIGYTIVAADGQDISTKDTPTPDTATRAETALREVAVAAHDANAAGPNEIKPFDKAAEMLVRTRSRMTSELQQSLVNDDFHLHYQPKVDLLTGAIVGAEALVRWEHPVFGLQRPDRFIPLAEQTGLIVDLGALVFAKAARVASMLRKSGIGHCPISVNVSAFQFREASLIEVFEAALARADLDASAITLELTESVFAETSGDWVQKLHALRARGFGLSIDDFGTGYSSLRYLKNFPVSEIKLDRSFVTGLDHDSYNTAITEAVMTIGTGLGVSVVAEGIETPEEHQALLDLRCRIGQGFLFSRPLDEVSFLRLFSEPGGLPWRHRFATLSAAPALHAHPALRPGEVTA